MNVSKSDVVNIVFQAVVGGIFAGVLSIGALFVERKKGRMLSISTQRLHLDQGLSACCGELQRQTRDKNVGIIEFDQAIDSMDHIICLQDKLQTMHQNLDFKFSMEDDNECFIHLTRLYTCFRGLRKKSVENLSIPESIDIEILCKNIIESHINSYVSSIVSFLAHFKHRQQK
jgi:hypothetical protein